MAFSGQSQDIGQIKSVLFLDVYFFICKRHSFFHLFNKSFLTSSYVPGTRNRRYKVPALLKLIVQPGLAKEHINFSSSCALPHLRPLHTAVHIVYEYVIMFIIQSLLNWVLFVDLDCVYNVGNACSLDISWVNWLFILSVLPSIKQN